MDKFCNTNPERRIKPDEVVDAYKKHPEVKPRTGFYYIKDIDDNCEQVYCCGLGIVYLDKLIERSVEKNNVQMMNTVDLDDDYHTGFVFGFDNDAEEFAEHLKQEGLILNELIYTEGWLDGLAARNAVMKAFGWDGGQSIPSWRD